MKKKYFLLELSTADYITLTAALLITIAFWLVWLEQIYLAIAIAFLSTFLDYLDGTVARKYGGSAYGKVLDSLYDILGWSLFPALVINIMSDWAWWAIIVTSLYCVASVARLGRFTVMGYVEDSDKYYIGVPVLFSKYALLLVFFWNAAISVLILAIMIPLTVSSKLIKKPHPFWAQLELVYAVIFFILYLTNA